MPALRKTYTEIMSNKYAENMQKLCNKYAEIMQQICWTYAKHMLQLCKHYAKHIPKLCHEQICPTYAEIMQTNMQKSCNKYSQNMYKLCKRKYANIKQNIYINYAKTNMQQICQHT